MSIKRSVMSCWTVCKHKHKLRHNSLLWFADWLKQFKWKKSVSGLRVIKNWVPFLMSQKQILRIPVNQHLLLLTIEHIDSHSTIRELWNYWTYTNFAHFVCIYSVIITGIISILMNNWWCADYINDQSGLEAVWVFQRGNIHTQPDRHTHMCNQPMLDRTEDDDTQSKLKQAVQSWVNMS